MQDNTVQPNPFQGGVPQDDIQSATPPPSPVANIPTIGDATPPDTTTTTTTPVSGDGTGPKPINRVNGKVLATIFGLVLLVGGIAAGLALVQQRTNTKESASGCTITYNSNNTCFTLSGCSGAGNIQKFTGPSCPTNQNPEAPGFPATDGTYCASPTNGAACEQVDHQFGGTDGNTGNAIGGGGVCSCGGGGGGGNPPPLACTVTFEGITSNEQFQVGQSGNFGIKIQNDRAGQGSTGSFVSLDISSTNTSVATITPATIQVDNTNTNVLSKTYTVKGTAVGVGTAKFRVIVNMKPCPACATSSNICNVELPIRVGTVATNSPTATATAGTAPQCTGIKIYDANFNEIPSSDWTKLSAGTQIKIAVTGTTPAGSFDKARFFVNDPVNPIGESPSTVPSNPAEYYIDYTIPSGVTSFTISGQLHQVQLDQWI